MITKGITWKISLIPDTHLKMNRYSFNHGQAEFHIGIFTHFQGNSEKTEKETIGKAKDSWVILNYFFQRYLFRRV